MIAALREEKELSGLLCNMIRELSVTLDDINKAAETDEFIVKMKKQVQLNEKSKKVFVWFLYLMAYQLLWVI